MKRLLLTLLITLSSFTVSAYNWSKVVTDLKPSIRALNFIDKDGDESWCTSFSIDERRQYFMTAEHCLGTQEKMDGYDVIPVYSNPDLDVAVVHGAFGVPSLHPGSTPAQGEEIAGYGYGYNVPMLVAGNLAAPTAIHPETHDAYTFYTPSWFHGMSGGPVINTSGKVIGLIQQGTEGMGFGRKWEDLRKATKSFWQFEK